MSSDYSFDVLAGHVESATGGEPAGSDRRHFLRNLVVGGGVLTAGGTVLAEFAPSAEAASTQNDIVILNAALILEELGRDFYAEAIRETKLTGQTATFVHTVHGHEVLHAKFVRSALGSYAKPSPRFDFGPRIASPGEIRHFAYHLEGLCTAALVGISPLLTRKTLKSASTLLPVEAQHVAWISNILGYKPAPSAFNPKDTIPGVERTIKPLIQS